MEERPTRPTLSLPRQDDDHSEGSADPSTWGRTARRKKKNTLKLTRYVKPLLIAGVLALVVFGVWSLFGHKAAPSSDVAYVDTGKYQSVVLMNGNAFYGKITSMNMSEVILSDVFYIQQPTDGKDAKFELVKRGNELSGPYDTMLINRSQVAYIENLKDDGNVVKTIKAYHAGKDK